MVTGQITGGLPGKMPNRITQSDWLNILVFVGKAGQSRREADRPSSKLRCCSICDDRPSKQRQRWGVGHHAAASKNLTSTANAQGPVSVKQVRGVCELATHHHPSNLTLFQLDHHQPPPPFLLHHSPGESVRTAPRSARIPKRRSTGRSPSALPSSLASLGPLLLTHSAKGGGGPAQNHPNPPQPAPTRPNPKHPTQSLD